MIVDKYHTSIDDPIRCSGLSHERSTGGRSQDATRLTTVAAFVCIKCNASFSCQKALDQHARKKHGDQREIDKYVGDWRQCPICETVFASRVALVTHLSEKRCRSKCRTFTCGQVFVSGSPPLVPEDELLRLQLTDRAAQKSALRQRHTHVLARKPASVGKRGGAIEIPRSCLIPRKRISSKRVPVWGADFTCSMRRLLALRHGFDSRNGKCPCPKPCSVPGDDSLKPLYRLKRKTPPSEVIHHRAQPNVQKEPSSVSRND